MSKKIGCGGFRIDDDTLKLKEDGTLYAAGGGVQPDWNQNDSTALDYIKNRPFYAEELPYVSIDVEGTIYTVYKVSSDIPSISNPQVGDMIAVWSNGAKGELPIGASTETGYSTQSFMCIVAFQDNATIEIHGVTVVLPERGTYFLKYKDKDFDTTITGVAKNGASTPEISWDGNTGTIKKLDEKFIPDMDSVILNSSTPDSTKKFRITVDDSGNITATAVTS